MYREKSFWYKWVTTYLLQLLVISVAAGIMLYFGRELCLLIRPVWEPNAVYYGLKWIEYNTWTFYFGFLFVSAVLLVIYHLRRFGKAMEQTVVAISSMYYDPEKKIHLAENFHEMEMELNEVRIKSNADRQAAKEATQRKNDLIMYMAHDLKTPLTSVIGYLSLVCNEPTIPDAVKEKYMGIALKKSLRLEELINEFFDITRFNFSHMVLEKSTINISVMLQQIVSEFMTEFDRKGLSVRCCITPDVIAFCDIGKMERVFDNLLKNIVNYSYAGTEISITLNKLNNHQLEIITENRGRTISPEMINHIFDQFFRLDASRSTRTGGAGLGLAVAKEIVVRHDGEITCESQDERIQFRIVMPGGID